MFCGLVATAEPSRQPLPPQHPFHTRDSSESTWSQFPAPPRWQKNEEPEASANFSLPPEEEGRVVRWAGRTVQGCLERDEGRQGDAQGISVPHLGMRGSWTETGSLGAERPARGWLYSTLERRKRCLRGGEAAFQRWRKFSRPEARRGERLREGEGRRGRDAPE